MKVFCDHSNTQQDCLIGSESLGYNQVMNIMFHWSESNALKLHVSIQVSVLNSKCVETEVVSFIEILWEV